MRLKPNTLIVVAGPTASGKTALAIQIAKAVDGEIVSADSMQIYRGVDIATAKPTPEELAAVPHHLIGFLPMDRAFSVADYAELARKEINDILSRGKVPVLCGGTGLYIKAIVDNVQYSEAITGDEALRERLRQLAEREGNDALWRRLEAMDPETAKRIHPNNVGRVIRAIEVMTVSGKSIREHEAESLREPCPYHVIELGLRYHDRETLYGRINRRVDKMVEMGLTEEVKAAREQGLTATAAQAIGCKELYSWLDGKETQEEALEKLKQSTRRYAKRQLTWFGTDQRMRWIEPDTLAAGETPLDKAMEILEKEEIHLVLLDIMMPGMDGLEMCRKIRETNNIPIIMLSAKSTDLDKILGLGTGADDYVVKPFNPLELTARVKSQLRRYTQLNPNSNTGKAAKNEITIRGLSINKDNHKVIVYGEEIKLTPIEFDILYLLASNPGRVFSTDEIFEKVWNEKVYEANNTVMVHIRRLRGKMKEDTRQDKIITTVWGVGYKIEK